MNTENPQPAGLLSSPVSPLDPSARIHTLKCWPEFFAAVVEGRKRFEIRKNDRDFRVGDCLVLQEWNPATEQYTREMCSLRVTYLTSAFMGEGFVALSVEPWSRPVSPLQRYERDVVTHQGGHYGEEQWTTVEMMPCGFT